LWRVRAVVSQCLPQAVPIFLLICAMFTFYPQRTRSVATLFSRSHGLPDFRWSNTIRRPAG